MLVESKEVVEENKKETITTVSYEPQQLGTINESKKYYERVMEMSYDELVNYLIKKYGPARYDYFINEYCTIKNKKVSRTNEGLYCHHIDEDKAIMLSNIEYANKNPFEYQKAERLVYCNMLEHFLLHILIFEKPKSDKANKNELQGIGGAVNYLCKQLNDLYCGYEYKQGWMKKIVSAVEKDYDSYIPMLRRLWEDIRKNKNLEMFISKEDLARGWNGNVYPKILKEL